jgi:peroxiredoxin Q/BCP
MAPTMNIARLVPTAVVALSALTFACASETPAPQTAATAPEPAPAPAAAPPAAAEPPAAAVAPPPPPPAPPAAMSSDAPAADDLVGKPAPDFTAPAQNGKTVHLAALKGKMVVVYFYPKDETAGCTKEACSFRDSWQAIAKTGAVLVGISGDGRESHKAFTAHYSLPFLLVTDADGTIGKSYGVPFEGHHQRQTIVIGADGNVRKVYRKVDVSTHAAQILDDLSHPG